MVRPLIHFLRSSVWTRATSIQSYRFFVASASIVLALFPFCGISLPQHCPGTCPAGTRCIGVTCLPSYSSIPCSTDSACRLGTCLEGHCVNKLLQPRKKTPSGSFCESNSQCSSGKCVLGNCTPPNLLEKHTFPKLADGSSCVFGSQCASGTCSAGYCIKKPLQPPKKPSSESFCLLDSECSSGKCALGKCTLPNLLDNYFQKLADGRSCVSGSQCASGACWLGKCVSAK
jgi:hypothetical protein